MSYRSALNRCWAAVSLLWIAWCLYWPFYARRQDRREINVAAAETFKICLQQKGMTAAGCATDRQVYTELDERLAWPPEQNAYQSFAGTRLSDALSFYTLLCLFPIALGYLLLRMVVKIFLWFARARLQNLSPSP